MSENKKADLLSSAEAATQNFSTDNVLDGGCVECGCEVFIRYHYDDDKPIPEAEFVLTDSNKTEISGKTDKQGMCKIQNMGCGGFEILLGEGSDEFNPKESAENNPVIQANPEYAAKAGEYFALYSLLSRQGYLTYDEDGSSDEFVDIDRKLFTWIDKEYKAAYRRFWELEKEINRGSTALKKAINKIHHSLAGEMAGMAHDNTAILLFCEIALGFVPVVGQAMDLYDLGCWGWDTCTKKELGFWHWATGVLVVVGFVPGLGDATKKTGKTIINALEKADSRTIQKAMKMLRSLSNGNLVKYLKKFSGQLSEYAGKAKALLSKIIDGLTKAIKNSKSWAVRLLRDSFEKLVKAMERLQGKIDEMVGKISAKVDEFIGKVVTRKTGTPHPKNTVVDADNLNAGKERVHSRDSDSSANKRLDASEGGSKSNSCHGEGEGSLKSNQCSRVGEPIDLNTGKVFDERQDFVLAGILPLEHQRYYHSSGIRETGLMGSLWRSNWDISLTIEGMQATFTDSDYTQGMFELPEQEEATTSLLKPQWRLHRGTQGELILKSKAGLEYHFGHAIGATLRLSKISDAYGNTIYFVYDRRTLKWVILSDERLIEVKTERNRITQLILCEADQTPLRELAHYDYDKSGRLLSVRGESGRNFDYQYSKEGYLTRWQDLAQTWVEHDYDEQGRAIASRCADGLWTDQIRYDDDNHVHYYKSAFGGIKAYHLDERNRPYAIVDAAGNRIEQQWQDDLLIGETNALGETTAYSYDAWGNITTATLPDGTVHSYGYNEQGWLTSYTDPFGASWLYEHNSQGELIQVTDPEGRVWQMSYTERGLRDSLTEPDGSVTRYHYNERGLLTRLEPAAGYGMNFHYDRFDRLVKRVSDKRDSQGNLTRRWHYHQSNPFPEKVIYEDGSEAHFSYDIEGNLTAVTDALGQTQHFTYGAFDKLKTVTDPLGATTRYHYNAEAEFAGVTNSHGQQWLYGFDKLGRIESERHYDGRTEIYGYDAVGRLVQRSKPDGHTLRYQYDVCGRLLQSESFDNQDNPTGKSWYEYDAASRLTYAENGDAWIALAYSPAGQLVSENINGTELTHQYDAAGRRIQSSGTESERSYQWQQQQLSALAIGSHNPLTFAYHPGGEEKQRSNGSGFDLRHEWSATGLLTGQQLGNQSLRQYRYDVLDRLTGIEDSHRGSAEFTLNPNSQITAVRQRKSWETKAGFVHLFGYDSELNLNEEGFGSEYGDNVVSLADERLKRQKRDYDKAGRVTEVGRFKYRYDECGRVIEKTESKDGFRPQSTRFIWNDEDRLTHIELPDGQRYRYRYDPFGRRIAKECLQTQQQTHYLWDGSTLVQQSQITADGTALTSTEYLYEPGSHRPVAQVITRHDSNRQDLHYIVTDHAGTPQELVTETGDIEWRGEQALWGKYQQQQFNLKIQRGYLEDAANEALTCDLRYQGQIEDKESGLYYNLNRYYDADSGQYLSPDPIGFAGGLRPQGYVHNPMDFVDPLGLSLISPKTILFSQDSIDGSFSDGSSINGLVHRLKNDPSYINKVEPIRKVRMRDLPTNVQERLMSQGAHKDSVFSLDNRRLYAAKEAGISKIPSKWATPEELAEINLNRRFSTETGGKDIRVRKCGS
ncbi:RHS repeat-associated core domain-containing protein [Vibrio rhizosphaerae]|uniref:RHS repeat-associated core domain-containing protein n=1 Tax=Vibrio rhizosphaerae TaxID=398736 RepID=A0ABU4IXD3_9VIBR|nr:RHS repeat-associated core domain-containing protein [Vibrio rhizosphaerae]MDW6093944.1 RHS repeat-associated core domain-containing protein [Vibrio rhizosphaerae]